MKKEEKLALYIQILEDEFGLEIEGYSGDEISEIIGYLKLILKYSKNEK